MIAVGLSAFAWVWTRPVGRDPYTTMISSMPTRADHPDVIALIALGLGLAVLGLVVGISAAIMLVGRHQSS